ncbi:hypothetical protein INT43_002490, partial [Umbelopsis isabellina]
TLVYNLRFIDQNLISANLIMTNITVKIRSSTGSTFDIEIDPEALTVYELKELLVNSISATTPEGLRLVYSGRILKDPDNVSSYNVQDGHVIHVVKTASNQSQQSSVSSTQPTPATSQPASASAGAQQRSPLAGLGGLGGFGAGAGGGMPDPEMMRGLMESPMMQSMLNNPELMRSIMMSNPQIRAMVEQNPEIGHVINDPSFLRQSMQMMRNPELMREMQRNNDRALSNIEAIPGGFNHLRRMYSTLQDPLESAARPPSRESDEANQRLAERLNVQHIPENQINTQALPNPWASNTANRSTTQAPASEGTGSQAAANPFAALGGSGGGGMSPFLNFGAPATGNAQNNPTNNNNTSSNIPGNTPMWMNPELLQFSMRMQQMMQQQQQGGGQAGNTQAPPFFNPFGAPQASSTPSEPPEQRFASQITQLEEMGFSERDKNIRALLATGGNVQAAIEYLLTQ